MWRIFASLGILTVTRSAISASNFQIVRISQQAELIEMIEIEIDSSTRKIANNRRKKERSLLIGATAYQIVFAQEETAPECAYRSNQLDHVPPG